jgi:hypothetical protein
MLRTHTHTTRQTRERIPARRQASPALPAPRQTALTEQHQPRPNHAPATSKPQPC